MNGCPWLEIDREGDYDCLLGQTEPCDRCRCLKYDKNGNCEYVGPPFDLDTTKHTNNKDLDIPTADILVGKLPAIVPHNDAEFRHKA
jgi:hypothetical protein